MDALLVIPEPLKEGGFLLPSPQFLSRENEMHRNVLTDVRLGKVSSYLFSDTGVGLVTYANWYDTQFPLATNPDLYSQVERFVNLSDELKKPIFVAESIAFLNYAFEQFLIKEFDIWPWEWPAMSQEDKDNYILGFKKTYLETNEDD